MDFPWAEGDNEVGTRHMDLVKGDAHVEKLLTDDLSGNAELLETSTTCPKIL